MACVITGSRVALSPASLFGNHPFALSVNGRHGRIASTLDDDDDEEDDEEEEPASMAAEAGKRIGKPSAEEPSSSTTFARWPNILPSFSLIMKKASAATGASAEASASTAACNCVTISEQLATSVGLATPQSHAKKIVAAVNEIG